jgi:ankyrin repeat protein
MNGSVPVVLLLLLAGSLPAPVAAAQVDAVAGIHAAARAGDAARIKTLAAAEPGLVRARDGAGRTPLHTAAYWSRPEPAESSPYLAGLGEYGRKLQDEYLKPVDTARALLAAGAEVDARDGEDLTALHWAAMRGNRVLVETLLASGAAVNATDKTYSATPLHLAVRGGHKSATEALLAAKADLKAKDAYGKTPLDYAESSGRQEMIQLLRRRADRP